MTSAIGMRAVSKAFLSKNATVEALHGVDLTVAPHEFVSVLGPSGCGKSTLMRIVAGLIPASHGEVTLESRRVEGPDGDVGVVFQSAALLPWRSVLGNVELQAEVRRLDRRQYRERARELLSLVGLDGFEASYPYQLSGGMQQRVALCRALLHDPALLLMDEPFAALDLLTREQMTLELQRIWLETRKTVLFITHSIAEAVFLSDRVVVMSARPGRVLEEIEVGFPRPRCLETMESPEFVHLVARARHVLTRAAGA